MPVNGSSITVDTGTGDGTGVFADFSETSIDGGEVLCFSNHPLISFSGGTPDGPDGWPFFHTSKNHPGGSDYAVDYNYTGMFTGLATIANRAYGRFVRYKRWYYGATDTSTKYDTNIASLVTAFNDVGTTFAAYGVVTQLDGAGKPFRATLSSGSWGTWKNWDSSAFDMPADIQQKIITFFT